ncbi:MAG: glucosaminidase domain-containing protein [Erysipelothrix sp.]|jgi:beta-N-acetylglucosaminidase|nr:glucosaminidase domain-containing protein [Erysipelothrix sp.]
MKKIILAILLMLNFQSEWVVQASLECTVTEYSLSNITGHNQFEVLGCYASFVDAQIAMNETKAIHPNLIIRHETSPSPLKIISASRAVVTSYPARLRDGTGNALLSFIYRSSALSTSSDSTYMPAYYDLRYVETISYNPNQTLVNVDANGNIEGSTGYDPTTIAYTRDTSYHQRGVVRVEVSGFNGFINIASVDIIPTIYVENNWTISLGGNTYLETQLNNQTQEKPYSIRPRVNEYRVSTNSSGQREIFHENFSFFSGNSRGTYTYGPAPTWLPNGRYYSYDGIRFYSDLDLKLPVLNGSETGEYYQYFSYLPFRSTSNLTGAQLDTFLEKVAFSTLSGAQGSAMYQTGQFFVDAQHTLGMNAVLVYAMALHESGRGTSWLAKNKNNLFGWGAKDANPTDAYMFSSIESSIYEHTGINLRGYMNPTDWRHFGQVLGNKNNGFNTKYASDPYWGQKIAGWAYRIDRYFNFVDYNYFPIIMVNDTTTTTLHKQASTGSVIQTIPARNQQRMFIASRVEGDWILTPSLLPLDNSRNTIYPNQSVGVQVAYPFSHNMAFIRPSNYRVINHSIARVPHLFDASKVDLPKQAMINSIVIVENIMTFNGVMTIPYLGEDTKVILTPRLILSKDGQQQIITAATTVVSSSNPSLHQKNFGFTSSFSIPDVTLKDAVVSIELQYQSAYLNQTVMLPVSLNSSQNSVLMGTNHQVTFTQVSDQMNMNIALVTIAQGDMNQDGRLSITDLVLMHRLILEIDPSSPSLIALGDMNQDGRLSVTDLVILHRTLLGLE